MMKKVCQSYPSSRTFVIWDCGVLLGYLLSRVEVKKCSFCCLLLFVIAVVVVVVVVAAAVLKYLQSTRLWNNSMVSPFVTIVTDESGHSPHKFTF